MSSGYERYINKVIVIIIILYNLCGSANKWSKGFVSSDLVRYDDSSLAAIRHVQSIIPVVRPRPNIRSHCVLFHLQCARRQSKA